MTLALRSAGSHAQEALAESKDSLSASQAIRAAFGARQESLEGKLAHLREQAEEVRGEMMPGLHFTEGSRTWTPVFLGLTTWK